MKYVERKLGEPIELASKNFAALILSGPRRSGKTTLLKHLFPEASYVLLEDPDVVARVNADPRGFVEECTFPVILDEIQTGLGRTGTLLAEEHEGVEADLTLIGSLMCEGENSSVVCFLKNRYQGLRIIGDNENCINTLGNKVIDQCNLGSGISCISTNLIRIDIRMLFVELVPLSNRGA